MHYIGETYTYNMILYINPCTHQDETLVRQETENFWSATDSMSLIFFRSVWDVCKCKVYELSIYYHILFTDAIKSHTCLELMIYGEVYVFETEHYNFSKNSFSIW